MTSPTPQWPQGRQGQQCPEWLPWREVMERALYGPGGFFRRERPAAHFRTSVHASPRYGNAVAELLRRVDAALGHPEELVFVDMGAGGGELSAAVLAALPPEVTARLRPYAVDLGARPAGLDPRVTWCAEPPRGGRGLLFANEWLDNVPLTVASVDPEGTVREVEVDPAGGTERLGAEVSAEDAEWLRRWWPLGPAALSGEGGGAGRGVAGGTPEPGAGPSDAGPAPGTPSGAGGGDGRAGDVGAPDSPRAEVGRSRDEAWEGAVRGLDAGLAVAVDYCHVRDTRPPYGTLTGYRDGRQVPPVPDGSCDLTAHVAADSLPGAVLVPQRAALTALGLHAARPPLALATTDPAGYVRALAGAGEAAELIARGGLGDFTWALTPVGPAGAEVAAALRGDRPR